MDKPTTDRRVVAVNDDRANGNTPRLDPLPFVALLRVDAKSNRRLIARGRVMPASEYNPDGHGTSLTAGHNDVSWSCICGARSIRPTQHEGIAMRGAATHMAAARRKARYAAARADSQVTLQTLRNGDVDVMIDRGEHMVIPAAVLPELRRLLSATDRESGGGDRG